MEKNKNKPKLRFPGFTDPWEQRKLGEIGETYTGLSGKTKDDFGHGDARFVTYMNIFSNPVSDLNGVDAIEIDSNQNEVKYGDVLFTTSSETPDEVGMASVWLENSVNMYLNSFCFGYRPTEKLNPYFMAYMLRSPSIRKNFKLLAQGISRYNISKNKTMEMEIFIPSILEQKLVGKFFNNLDNLITLHQRKLNHLQDKKKGLLQKMFPKNGEDFPELRFPEFTDPWEQRKLGEVFNQTTEYVNPQAESMELWSLTVENGLTPKTDRYVRDFLVKKEDKYKAVRPNDIVYNPMNMTLGAIGYNNMSKIVAVSGYYVTMKLTDLIDGYYIKTWMQRPHSINLYKMCATGSLIEKQRVQYPTFAEINFTLPEIEEQKKIGAYFRNIDKLISLHQRKLNHLQEQKKALLQQMFV